MLTIANRQEQYLLTNRSYAATTAALNLTAPTETAAGTPFRSRCRRPRATRSPATAIGNQAGAQQVRRSDPGKRWHQDIAGEAS
jgi:hypothetical protein